jgi:uncharacterized protein YegL
MFFQVLFVVALAASARGYATTPPPVCDGLIDVAYILDVSGSISDDEWEIVRQVFILITDALNVGPDNAHVGIVTFSTSAVLFADLADCPTNECVEDHVNSIKMERSANLTNIADGFRVTRTQAFAQGDRPSVPNVCLFFSDGEDNVEVDQTEPEADLLKNVCRIVSIGIDGADITLLESLSSQSDLFIVPNADFNALLPLVQPIIQGTCNQKKQCDCVNLPSYRKRRFAGAEL